MEAQEILEKYGLTKDTAVQYIDAITRLNQTEAAEEIQVSRDTIHRYKKAFRKMTDTERALIITSLFHEKLANNASNNR